MKNFIKFLFVALLGIIMTNCQENNDVAFDQKTTSYVNESNLKDSEPHFETIIAELARGDVAFTLDVSVIKTRLQNAVNNGSELNLSYDTVFINNEMDGIFLVAKDISKKATTKVKLVLDGSTFYEKKYFDGTDGLPVGQTCTCTGCTSTGPGSSGECEPKGGNEGWYCTDCSEGKCVKTVSYTIGGGSTS